MGHQDQKLWPCYVIAFACLILIHELGHAIAARFLGLKIYAVKVVGFGGLCNFEPPRRTSHALLVYSGGLIAQFALFLITEVYLGVRGKPSNEFEKAIVDTFTYINILIFFLNLMPVKRLRLATDGYAIWKLLLHAIRG